MPLRVRPLFTDVVLFPLLYLANLKQLRKLDLTFSAPAQPPPPWWNTYTDVQATDIFAAALPLLVLALLALKTTLDVLPLLAWTFHAICG